MVSAVFLVVVFIAGISLSLCSAEVISCNATQVDNQTVYTILNPPRDLGVGCEYSWANSSQYVLANNKDKFPGLVESNSIKELVTSECLNKITYSLDCILEGEPHTVHCTINCSRNGMFEKSEEHKESSLNWIAATVIVIIVIFFVIGLVGLCCKFRQKISKNCSCLQHRCFYTPVKMVNSATTTADGVVVIV